MNIPKVTHTPRVEAVIGRKECWSDKIISIEKVDTGGFRMVIKRNGRCRDLSVDEAPSLLACLAAALGCEVVQREEKPATAPAPSRPEYVKVTDLRGDKTQPLTVGKVYKVEDWYGVSPRVRHDLGGLWCLSNRGETPASIHNTLASWVPADAPATCEPTDAQVEAAWEAMARRWWLLDRADVRAALKAALAVRS